MAVPHVVVPAMAMSMVLGMKVEAAAGHSVSIDAVPAPHLPGPTLVAAVKSCCACTADGKIQESNRNPGCCGQGNRAAVSHIYVRLHSIDQEL